MLKKTLKNFISFTRRTDNLLLGLCLVVSALSLVLIYGIYQAEFIQYRVFKVQVLAIVLGVGAAYVISLIDYHFVLKFWKVFMPTSIALVVLTYFIGIQRASYIDDKAWLKIPFTELTFQPSEILKMAFILTLAMHLEKVHESINDPRTLMGLCAHGGFVTILVVLQGDHGTALVFVAIFSLMVFAAGLSFKYVGAAIGSVVLASPLLWFFVLDQDKKQRILTVFNPMLDPMGKGYQQSLGLTAIGSGQVWGKGIMAGKPQYIPEMHNDFIFAYAAEAVGFVGSLGIILLFVAITISILINARRAVDQTGSYICVGVFAIIAFQTIWGIGMCISLLPVAGLTLPFLSAGGTSVVMTYASIGLVLNVHRYSRNELFASN